MFYKVVTWNTNIYRPIYIYIFSVYIDTIYRSNSNIIKHIIFKNRLKYRHEDLYFNI